MISAVFGDDGAEDIGDSAKAYGAVYTRGRAGYLSRIQ